MRLRNPTSPEKNPLYTVLQNFQINYPTYETMKYDKWNCNLETKFQLHELTWWWHLLVKDDGIKGNEMSRECAGMQGSSWKT